MVVGILTEKPSAARHLATALGGMSGTYNGERFVITQARGHLYEFADPHMMVRNPGLVEKYRKWDLDNLPWDPGDLDWTLDIIPDAAPVAQEVKRTLSGCDEIVIGTDVDPTGEGGMIAVNAALELGLKPTRWSRMYFTDEAATSLRTAFTNRRPVPSLTDFDEYKKARYRSQFDLLSMQFTRIATAMARSCGQDTVLRQGRLKSAMVTLVGDQLKAYNDYVKKPFFQNRFRDENDVLYTNPDEPRFDRKDQVPRHYEPSAVVLDSTTTKRTAPRNCWTSPRCPRCWSARTSRRSSCSRPTRRCTRTRSSRIRALRTRPSHPSSSTSSLPGRPDRDRGRGRHHVADAPRSALHPRQARGRARREPSRPERARLARRPRATVRRSRSRDLRDAGEELPGDDR